MKDKEIQILDDAVLGQISGGDHGGGPGGPGRGNNALRKLLWQTRKWVKVLGFGINAASNYNFDVYTKYGRRKKKGPL